MMFPIEATTLLLLCVVLGVLISPYVHRLLVLLFSKVKTIKKADVPWGGFEFEPESSAGNKDTSDQSGILLDKLLQQQSSVTHILDAMDNMREQLSAYRAETKDELSVLKTQLNGMEKGLFSVNDLLLRVRIIQYMTNFPERNQYIEKMWQECLHRSPPINGEIEAAYNDWKRREVSEDKNEQYLY